jgi:hypothetical protein
LRIAVALEAIRASSGVKSEFVSASHVMTGRMAPASAADASVFIATIEPAAVIAASVNNPEIRVKNIHSSLGSRH